MDELLTYYNRELTQIRRLAAAFAEAHPAVAGRLRLTADGAEDPHVGMLLEGFAYLAGRIRLKLDDEFPELTQSLLSVLYPHYLAPIPSMAIVQFSADAGGTVIIPAGTELDTEPAGGESCRYRTCYPVALPPLAVAAAKFAGRPAPAPANPRAAHAGAVLRLTLRGTGAAPFSGPHPLRFFLRGSAQDALALHELLHHRTVSIAVASGPGDSAPVLLGPDAIRAVGFEDDEALLPADGRSFSGYRLLTEYFCFPEKFLFFELDLGKATREKALGKEFDLFFYVDGSSRELERSVTRDNFALGCTPVVNLFRQRAEPILLSHESVEVRVVPDARRISALEVYSVTRVAGTFEDGTAVEYRPFYGLTHGGGEQAASFWHGSRRTAEAGGSELFLTLAALGQDPDRLRNAVLSVETLCLNRDIPARLPFGGGRPLLSLNEPQAAVTGVSCLTPPTATLRPPLGQDQLWRLVSHLSLNHLSLSGGDEAADALREILILYDFRDQPQTRAAIDSILSVTAVPGSARLSDGLRSQFCRGVDVTIDFDDQRWSSSGLSLFAEVLERFLGLYCAINSFTRLTVTRRGRQGAVRTWPPRAGKRRLL